eukprot:TRINITY_DN17062_c0_g1_i1.p1 TRINITY_DN17062_c0_g1~~TRINITY_DN17062_c0_g1_i1.p1  ORF type:complete len:147 (+),score=50.28 TRINITY_DN17062_c0_g1_i1:52-492(+)
MSGIIVDSEKINPFIKRLSQNCKNNPLRYIILKINDTFKEVEVDSEGERSKTWEEFTEILKQKKPCYALFDLDYHNSKNGIDTNKLITILWSGNSTLGRQGIKEKMLTATTMKTLQQNLSLHSNSFQAGNEEELSYQYVLDHANRF